MKYKEEKSKTWKFVETKSYARSGSVLTKCGCGGDLVVLETWGKDGCCVCCTSCGTMSRYELIAEERKAA